MLNLSSEEKAALKGQGIILSRDQEHFVARIVTQGGVLNAEQLDALSKVANQYGNGKVALTSRMSVEVQGIPYENIEPLRQALLPCGLASGGTGPKVRPIVPCKGTVCVHGLIDTQKVSQELHEKFYEGWHDIKLPSKFKIGVGGCPNNCIKPGLNDFGIMGQRVPVYDPEKCRGCQTCNVEKTCPMKVCVKADSDKMVRDSKNCTNCGTYFYVVQGTRYSCKCCR